MRLAWAMDDRATGSPAALGGKPWVPPPKPPDPAKAAAVDVYGQLISKIKEATAANELEAQQEKALTQAQKFQLDIQKLVTDGKITQAQASSKLTTNTLKEFDASEKAAKAARDFAKSLADNTAAWGKLIDDSEASSNKLQDDTRAQLDHNAAIGLGAAALADLEAARTRDKAAMLEHEAEVFRTIDLSGATSETLLEEAKHWRELADAKQQGAKKQEDYDKLKQVWQSVDQTAHDAFTHIFENGRDTFQRLADTLKATVLDVLYQMTLRPWIIQMVAGITGSQVDTVSQALGVGSGKGTGISSLAGLGSLSSGGGILGSIGNALGIGGGAGAGGAVSGLASGADLGMMYGGAADAGATLGGLGAGASFGAVDASIAAGATEAAAGGSMAVAGMASAIPVIGWAIAAAAILYSIFGGKGGGPKTEIGYGYGIDRTPNADQGKALTDSIQAQYAQLVGQFGGTAGKLDVGYFSSADPQGTALSQLQVTAALNGQDIYNRAARTGGTENVARGDAALKTEMAQETERVIL
jgi:flagellar biosynthesis regulator FlaF